MIKGRDQKNKKEVKIKCWVEIDVEGQWNVKVPPRLVFKKPTKKNILGNRKYGYEVYSCVLTYQLPRTK